MGHIWGHIWSVHKNTLQWCGQAWIEPELRKSGAQDRYSRTHRMKNEGHPSYYKCITSLSRLVPVSLPSGFLLNSPPSCLPHPLLLKFSILCCLFCPTWSLDQLLQHFTFNTTQSLLTLRCSYASSDPSCPNYVPGLCSFFLEHLSPPILLPSSSFSIPCFLLLHTLLASYSWTFLVLDLLPGPPPPMLF